MRKLFTLLLLILVFQTGFAQEMKLDDTELDSFIERVIKAGGIPAVAVSVVTKDEVLYQKGLGFADVKNQRPVDENTLFYLGSVSKAFTAALVGSLVDEGKLSWTEPVISYMPELRLYDSYTEKHVTMLDLLSHRTGLPRHEMVWYKNSRSRRDLLKALEYLENSYPYRGGYQYNNLMVMLAGYIAGSIENSTWEQVINEKLLTPLGWESSTVLYDEFLSAENKAVGYKQGKEGTEPTPYVDLQTIAPAGGIYSNLTDMNKWMQMLLNRGTAGGKQIISQNSFKTMFTPQTLYAGFPDDEENVTLGYCLGWVGSMYEGVLVYNHGGGIDGFSTLVFILPHRDLGITILTNRGGAGSYANLIGGKIITMLLDKEFEDKLGQIALQEMQQIMVKNANQKNKADSLPPTHDLQAYTGIYNRPGYGDIAITLVDDELQLKAGYAEYKLKHHNLDYFRIADFATGVATYVAFETSGDGEVDSFKSKFEIMLDPLEFVRVAEESLNDPEYLKQFVGEYIIAGVQRAVFSIDGRGKLVLNLPNQPQYTLDPKNENSFTLADQPIEIEIVFSSEEENLDSVTFNQPNGTFAGKKVVKKDSK